MYDNMEDAVQEYVRSTKSARAIGREFNIGKDAITNELKRRGLLRPKKDNSYNTKYFSVIDTEEKAYWLGFIYADGCIYNDKKHGLEICLSEKDIDHLYKFKECIEYKGDIHLKTVKLNGNEFKACRINLYGSEIVEDLIKHGAEPRKSFTIHYPEIPDELDRHFIRGFFDGDGSIYYSCNKLSISILGTKPFLHLVQTIFIRDLGLSKVKIYEHKNVKEYKKSRQSAVSILHYLYDDSHIYLNRKYSKYALLTQSMGSVK